TPTPTSPPWPPPGEMSPAPRAWRTGRRGEGDRPPVRRGGRVPRCAAARPPAPCGGRRGGPVHDPDGARGHRDRHLLGRALPPHARAAVEPAGRLDRADR